MPPMLRQRSPEWLAARRQLITATDIPIILGLSPYKSESTLAQEKLGQIAESEPSLLMSIGQALEPVIAAEYARLNDVQLTRYRGLVTHPRIGWAGASPDYRRKRQRYLVELKDTRSRRWPTDGVPQDVEAQVRWQLGVTGFPIADVAALKWGTVETVTIEHDPALFEQLVTIAEDFRARMAAGGPFAEDAASIRSRYPIDDGTELEADAELNQLVAQLLKWRATIKEAEVWEAGLETQIKQRITAASRVNGDGWTMSYRKSKDSSVTDWQSVAAAQRKVLEQIDQIAPAETGRDALALALYRAGFSDSSNLEALDTLESIHTGLKPGGRSFRLTERKEQGQ